MRSDGVTECLKEHSNNVEVADDTSCRGNDNARQNAIPIRVLSAWRAYARLRFVAHFVVCFARLIVGLPECNGTWFGTRELVYLVY